MFISWEEFFKEYKKHLDPSDVDYSDTQAALELVLDAASHANEMMRKLVGSYYSQYRRDVTFFSHVEGGGNAEARAN